MSGPAAFTHTFARSFRNCSPITPNRKLNAAHSIFNFPQNERTSLMPRHAWLLAARRLDILFVTGWFSGVEDPRLLKASLGAALFSQLSCRARL
jgi:hypothetical protein